MQAAAGNGGAKPRPRPPRRPPPTRRRSPHTCRPTEIAANRTQLAQLVATNVFGQNTPAIASTEIQYAEMWAQDALAMDTYTGSSAAATKLTPFTAAPQITNAGGLAGQAAAVAQAAGTSAGSAQSAVSSLSSLTNPWSWLLQVGANLSTDYTDTLNGLLNSMLRIGRVGVVQQRVQRHQDAPRLHHRVQRHRVADQPSRIAVPQVRP